MFKNTLKATLLFCALLFSSHVFASNETIKLFISDKTVTCQAGVQTKECMLIKRSKTQKQWEYFYDEIEGFAYSKGTQYELLIKVTRVKNPPADGSNLKYSLVRIIQQSTASKGLPLANTQWIIEHFHFPPLNVVAKKSHITIAANEKTFSGNDGCNYIHGSVSISNNSIKFGGNSGFASTKMFCENMQQSNQFNQALAQANRYEIKGGELRLYKNKSLLMTLESFR